MLDHIFNKGTLESKITRNVGLTGKKTQTKREERVIQEKDGKARW